MFNQVSYTVLIERLRAFADGHYLIKSFTHGMPDAKDITKSSVFPWMHVVPKSVTPSTGSRAYSIDVIFADLPRNKAEKQDNEKEVVSDCIRLCEDLLAEVQNGYTIFGTDVEITGAPNIEPFISDFANSLSGAVLSIELTFPWNWSACDIPADWSVGGSGSSGGGQVPSALVLKVNGVDNTIQDLLDIVNGTNTTIEDLGDGRVRINSSGGVGSVSWGDIIGNIADQLDLALWLNEKADITSLAEVAFTGDYNDLTNLPSIPPSQVQSDWNQTDNTQVDYIQNKPTLPPVIGDMTKAVYDTDNDGIVDSAERVQIVVRNSTGSALLKGQVVYLSGATGNRPNAVLADASTEATSSKTIGLVMADIANNADGNVAVNGTLHDLDTSSFTDGATLWLSETAGAMQQNTPPAEPAHAVFIGYVARSHPNQGRIVLAIQNGYELNEIHGVLISNELTDEVLMLDGDGLWKNKSIHSNQVANDSSVTGSNVTEALDNLLIDVTNRVQQTLMINTDAPLSGGGDLSSDLTLSIPKADSSTSGYLDKTDYITFNGKQDAITLTTSGTTGPSTLTGSTLNIPNYTTATASAVIKSVNAVTHTGTTAETIIFSGVLPISLAANDQIDFSHFLGSNVTNGSTIIWRGYINTQNNLTGAIEIYRFTNSVGTAVGLVLGRRVMVNSVGASGVIRFWAPTQLPGQSQPFFSANAALLTGTLNTTGNIYFILTCAISASPFIANMFHTNITITR